MKQVFLRIIFALFFALSIAHAREGNRITLQLRWYHQFQFAGFYVGMAKGFYRDEGIDLEIIEGRPGIALTEFVLERPNRISISNSGLIVDFVSGKPIVILEPLFQHAPDVLISLESKNIRKPSDLIGKRVMVQAFRGDPIVGFRGMVAREGVDPNRVLWTKHSLDIDELIQGRADVMAGYVTTQLPELRMRGVKIRTMSPLDYGIDLYGDVLFTSQETAKKSPELLRRFLRATHRGWMYAFEHTDETIDLIESLPTIRPQRLRRDLFTIEAQEMRKFIQPELIPIGFSNPGRWNRIIDLYREFQELPRDGINTEKLFFPTEEQARQRFANILRRIVVALAVAGAIALFWIFILRRQIRLKTQALAETMSHLREEKSMAEHSNEIKSLFLANMSHEIRTPLTAILGFSELLKNEHLSAEERLRYLAIIERTGQSLATILGDILDLSKIEAEKFEIRCAMHSLRSILDDVEAILALRARSKRLGLYFIVPSDLPDAIITDSVRLKQILLNVIGNAVKFTDKGSVEVRVSHENNRLIFRVIDSGPGIAPEAQKKLFQTFSEIDPSIRRTHGGTGLGLSLSKRLARLLGGDVLLERSVPGEGSVFRIEIRWDEVNADIDRPWVTARVDDTRKSQPLRGRRILVVDDSVDNQVLVRLFLEKAGAEVGIANHGGEALNEISKAPYDLVLMDIQMPIVDGYTATEELRARGYTGSIIALTANAMKEDIERSMEAGCDSYLQKPVKQKELIDAILDTLPSSLS